METKKLGCLTRGGIIAFAVSILLFGTVYLFKQNVIFSPGELSSRTTGQLLLGFSSHLDLSQDCQLCHPAPWDSVNMADLCLDCHQDIQAQLLDINSLHGLTLLNMTSIDCRACHTDHKGPAGKTTEFSGDDFPHDLVSFSLQSHQPLDLSREIICTDCHPNSFLNFDPILCQDCHEQINQSYLDAHVIVFDLKCTSCHDGLETINKLFDHDRTAFSLTGKHQEAICEDCHSGAVDLASFTDAPTACIDCHLDLDPHSGNLGTHCEDCHNAESWTSVIYDHSQTGFILDGGHTSILCDACHLDLEFQGLSPECVSCHLEDEPHQTELGTDCAACHTTNNWLEIQFDHSDPYAEKCSFCHQDQSPINHYPGQCSACHLTSAWLPATFDHNVAQAYDCIACHIPDTPSNHFGGQCSICHSTSRWKPSTINHTFPINHEGANGKCTNCHNTYPAYTCYKCHEHSQSEVKNEHEGVSNLNNCTRCHWDGQKHDDD